MCTFFIGPEMGLCLPRPPLLDPFVLQKWSFEWHRFCRHDWFPASSCGWFVILPWLPGRPRFQGFPLYSVHPPLVPAPLHTGAWRLSRTHRTRPAFCRPSIRRVLTGNRTGFAWRQRRIRQEIGHCELKEKSSKSRKGMLAKKRLR